MEKTITSFEEFWPYYLEQHAHPLCRKLHFVGTTLAVGTLVGGVMTANPLMVAAAPVIGYGFAWVGHFVVEKNRPATFTYPLWSLRGDFVMWWKMATLKLDAELADRGITWQPPESRSLRAV